MLFRMLLVMSLSFNIHSYSGSALYGVELENDQMNIFSQIAKENNLDIWETRKEKERIIIEVFIQTDFREIFETWLNSNSIAFNILNDDIERTINEVNQSNQREKLNRRFKRSPIASGPVNSPVGTFATLDEIYSWLDSLAQKYSFVEVTSLGKSYEGRDMKLLKIAPGVNKSIVFVDAGIHAREWLAPASTIYTIEKIIEHFVQNSRYKSLFDRYEYHFLPVTNPDGYFFTFQEAANRLWRKTRKPYEECYGVDANRNFDVAFAKYIHITGIGHNPCHQTYHGPSAFSEPETANLRDHILTEADRMKFYMTVHCCADSLILPFTYTDQLPDNMDEIRRVGTLMTQAMKAVDGYEFKLGTGTEIFHQLFSGISMDWVLLNTNTTYAYVLETKSNFIAPVSTIPSSGEEVYQSILTAVIQMNSAHLLEMNSLCLTAVLSWTLSSCGLF